MRTHLKYIHTGTVAAPSGWRTNEVQHHVLHGSAEQESHAHHWRTPLRVACVITELSNTEELVSGIGVREVRTSNCQPPACFLSCDLFSSSFLAASGGRQPYCCQAGGRVKASQGAGLDPEHVYSLGQSPKAWLTFPSRPEATRPSAFCLPWSAAHSRHQWMHVKLIQLQEKPGWLG